MMKYYIAPLLKNLARIVVVAMVLLPSLVLWAPAHSSAGIRTVAVASCSPTDGNCADCQGGGNGCVPCSTGLCKDTAVKPNAGCTKQACDLVEKYVNPLINLLSISFGTIAVISLILGGIQYSASAGDPQKVTKAKSRIINTIFAIVAFFFMYSFLQFLVPGGLFNRAS